jgi:Na+-transporting methylmalonyl-CoA/oxaloacetate decarboxylase gamma subunit
MNSEMNTLTVTIIGLGVVMATLVALWFITRVVSFLVQAATSKSSLSLKTRDSHPENINSETPLPQAHSENNNPELIAIITAAAASVLGSRVRVLSCVEDRKIQNNGWMLSARNEQVQSFPNRMNRR